ncbi:IS66 family insertion sequence element accessory protein TnpA [Nannocystis pusilla]|uniref:IS66 family insertion sequence element accessory protein TnpA n=1 Tax=Nannocystis pusilla TaxID=889268 RepID=UPI003B7B79BD
MTTQERWRAHVDAWKSSGLSCKAYAAKAGVNPRTLTWWKSKLASAGANGPAPASFRRQPQRRARAADDGTRADGGGARAVPQAVPADARAVCLARARGRRRQAGRAPRRG